MNSSLRTPFFTRKAAQKCLPAISTQDNKAQRGRALLFCGSKEYPGAAVLAAKAALRTGAGYVNLAAKNLDISHLQNPDFLVTDLAHQDWRKLKFDAVLIGPGFGVNEFTAQILRDLIAAKAERVVIDADAITVCAQWKLFPLPRTWIMTPHTGELARCIPMTVAEINADREEALKKAIEICQCVVLLKGHRTLVGNHARQFVIPTGSPALAKSGTGDVLAGMIVALRSQGLSPMRAALLASYVHGAAAQVWGASGRDNLSMMASDLLELVPKVLFRLRKSEIVKTT